MDVRNGVRKVNERIVEEEKKLMELKITTLIENNPDNQNKLCFEHGLSLLIEADGKRILFDTGQSGDFIKNAKILNQNLTKLDWVLISHGHYDHSGGFEKLVEKVNRIPELIVGAEFFKPKYKILSDNEYKYNGNAFDEEYISKNNLPLKKVKEDIEYLTENIIVFHHFKRSNDFEKRNNNFFIKENSSYIPDEFDDEICLGIVTEKGLIVIVGCSHVGAVNILDTISKKVSMPIYAIIGGTHLIEADELRMQKTIDAFKERNLQLLAVSHCTGKEGIQLIKENFSDKFSFNITGNIIKL